MRCPMPGASRKLRNPQEIQGCGLDFARAKIKASKSSRTICYTQQGVEMIAYYIGLLGEGLTNFLVKNRAFLCKVRFSRLQFADYCAGVQVFASA